MMDEHFQFFASDLEASIAAYGKIQRKDFVKVQNKQLDDLLKAEEKFKKVLLAHPWGPGTYVKFVEFICDQKRNILGARPFFRERQHDFTDHIAIVFKRREAEGLYGFRINWEFINWVMKTFEWSAHSNKKPMRAAAEVAKCRRQLVVTNLPLAVARARIFWSRTPQSQMSFMDEVQTAAQGLLAGIDKFCPPYGPSFRHTLIGRMVSYLIENYSDTLLHFYPGDRRKLYRANKAVSRMDGTIDYDVVASFVNEGVEDPSMRTTADEIRALMLASSVSSLSASSNENEDDDGGESQLEVRESSEWSLEPTDSDDQRPDEQVERMRSWRAMADAIPQLPLFERKLLMLHGVAC